MPSILGLIGRVAFALLAAVIVFVILLVLGGLVIKYVDPAIGEDIKKFAALIAFLAGVVYFLTGPRPTVPPAV